MKKNNTTEKSVLNAEKITKALKEGTEKTLRNLVNEAISNLITEDDEKEEPVEDSEENVVDDNSFEVEDVDVDDESSDEGEAENEEDSEESDDDEWAEFDEFKTGDNDYDFTEEEEGVGEKLLKIVSKIEDGDELIITKDGNELEVSNQADGTEEVIELELDDEIETDDVDSADDDSEDVDIELDITDDSEDNTEDDTDSDDEFEFEFDDEEELSESTNLGYTDNYQSKTAMTTPPNKEVANPKDTYSMDDVPEGDGKRWAGKGEGKPFEEKVCCENEELMDEPELDEATNVGGAVQQRSSSKSHIPAGRKNYVPKGTRHASFGSDYTEVVESIKAENKELKENLQKIMGNLKEAAVLNVNLGRIVKLLSEETTTKEEKKSILERFNNVKTVNEGKTLYDTIKRELNESKKSTVMLENTISVGEKKNINETTIFSRSENPSLNLMDRLDNLWKK